MKLFKQLQVGIPLSTVKPILNFLTYHDNSAGCKKVTETMRDWCVGRNYSYFTKDGTSYSKHQKKLNAWKPIVFDNVPLDGFKFESVTSRWSTSNKVFRIIDPRGFICEIYAENAINLILNSKMDNGEILDKCIWFRNGGKNELVNINSEIYLDIVEKINRAASAKPISIKDIKTGDTVNVGYHIDMVYLGHFKPVFQVSVETSDSPASIFAYGGRTSSWKKYSEITGKKKLHCFASKDDNCHYAVQKPNIKKIIATCNSITSFVYEFNESHYWDMTTLKAVSESINEIARGHRTKCELIKLI